MSLCSFEHLRVSKMITTLVYCVVFASAQKSCFFCEYSYIISENGNSNVTLSGTPNCLLDLASSDVEIRDGTDADLCFTQITETYTNDSDIISLKRGIFYNSKEETVQYPKYSNSTDENAQCTTDLCNTYESNFERG